MFWGFSVTFMAIDWMLSLNPKWFSTMFGLLFIADQGLTGMAFLITVMVLLSARRPMSEVLTHAICTISGNSCWPWSWCGPIFRSRSF